MKEVGSEPGVLDDWLCVCCLCLVKGGNVVVYLHTLNVWKAGMGAYEDVVLFALQDGFLHDERIAGVELLRLVILIMSPFVCCERFE